MKNFTLLDQYKFSKKTYDAVMPISSIILFIVAVVMFIIYPNIFWFGIIFLGLAGITLVMYFLIRRYLNKKIAELESQDVNTNDVANK